MTTIDVRLERAWSTVSKYADESRDASGAMDSLTEEIKACARRINEIGRAFPTFDLLAYVRFSQSVVDLNTYRESSHLGSQPLVEMVALALTAQPTVVAGDDSRTTQKRTTLEAVRQVVQLGFGLMDLITARRILAALHQGPSRDVLASLARDRELFMRTPTFEHIAERTLDELFGKAPMETICRSELGFTAREACGLFRAIGVRCNAAAHAVLERLTEFAPHIDSDPTSVASWIWNLDKVPSHAASELHEVFDRIWLPIPDEATFAAEDLVHECADVSPEAIRDFLTVFEHTPATGDAGDVIAEAINGPSPLRTSPILQDKQGRRFLVHGGIGIHAVREALEQRLKKSADWEEYQNGRASYLERSALEILSNILPGAKVWPNPKYYGPTPDQVAEEPSKYTGPFESDGLLVIEDIALIVEAKAGSVRPHGRSGHARTLVEDLHKLVTKASEQAERLHRLIQKDRGVRLRDESWLDLSAVREVHSIAVSLDDLGGFTTMASKFIASGLLSPSQVPWMVSLYDLRVVGDVIQRPSEFIAYLRRRTDPETVTYYNGVDELDFFMAFIGDGLRLDDAENRSYPAFPAPTGASAAAGENDNDTKELALLASHTDPLDAWYRHEHGRSSVPVPRPEVRIHPRCREVVDALAERRDPGWLSIGATLVGLDSANQKRFAGHVDAVIAQARSGDPDYVRWPVDSGPEHSRSVLVFRAVEDASSVEAEMNELASYVSSARDQMGTAVGAGLMFDAEEPAVLKGSHYDNRPHQASSDNTNPDILLKP